MADGWLKLSFDSPKLDALREQLAAKAGRLHEVLFARVSALTYQLQSKVTAKLSNQLLRVRTGVLRGSVNASTTTDGTTIRGTVEAAAGAAHYGVFHEKGNPHAWPIVATKARALAFQLSVKQNASTIFAKSVMHPALPERSFMRSTLQESEQEIREALAQAVADVLLGKN
jgi:hypothetical protein